MFEKTRQKGLSEMVTEWENMKPLSESVKESSFLM